MSTGSLKIKQGATGASTTSGYSVLWASTSGMMYLNQPGGITTPLVGTSGTSGINGAAGSSGTSGTSGTSGISGSSGTSGISGTPGANGTSGTSGVSSPAGLVPGTGTSSMKNDDALVTTPATASGPRSIAIGNAACANSTSGLAIGDAVCALNTKAIAIGSNVCAIYADGFAVAVGHNLYTGNPNLPERSSILFGSNMLACSAYGGVIGFGQCNVLNFSSVSVGVNNHSGQNSVSVGRAVCMDGDESQGLGIQNTAYQFPCNSVLGTLNNVCACSSVSIGYINCMKGDVAPGSHNTFIGSCNTNPSNVANPMCCVTLIGYKNTACGNNFGNTAIGWCNNMTSFFGVAIGRCNNSQGDNSIVIGSMNTGPEGVIGIGYQNTTSRGYNQMIGYNNSAPGGGQCHIIYGVANVIYGDDSETANRAANVAMGVCNTINIATRTTAIGYLNCLTDSDGRNSVMIGNENRVYCGATGSTFIGNNNIGATGICNAYVHGNGITSQVSDHFHTTNLFLTAPLGAYVSDACFYAAGGITGQAYMLDSGSHTLLTIAGFNP